MIGASACIESHGDWEIFQYFSLHVSDDERPVLGRARLDGKLSNHACHKPFEGLIYVVPARNRILRWDIVGEQSN